MNYTSKMNYISIMIYTSVMNYASKIKYTLEMNYISKMNYTSETKYTAMPVCDLIRIVQAMFENISRQFKLSFCSLSCDDYVITCKFIDP